MALTASPRRGYSPMEDLPVVFTLGSEGADCAGQAAGILHLRPSWRAVIGTLLVCCPDDAGQHRWLRPWFGHCWLVDDDGLIRDPSLRNLEHWAATTGYTLPGQPESLTAALQPEGPASAAELERVLSAGAEPSRPEHVLRYFPHVVGAGAAEAPGPERQAATNWRAAARISGEDDGLTLEQLETLWRTGPAACITLRKMARLRQQGAERPHRGFGKVAR
jgi:hypothetical protein